MKAKRAKYVLPLILAAAESRLFARSIFPSIP